MLKGNRNMKKDKERLDILSPLRNIFLHPEETDSNAASFRYSKFETGLPAIESKGNTRNKLRPRCFSQKRKNADEQTYNEGVNQKDEIFIKLRNMIFEDNFADLATNAGSSSKNSGKHLSLTQADVFGENSNRGRVSKEQRQKRLQNLLQCISIDNQFEL